MNDMTKHTNCIRELVLYRNETKTNFDPIDELKQADDNIKQYTSTFKFRENREGDLCKRYELAKQLVMLKYCEKKHEKNI